MRCASTGAPILWLLRGCQNTWECLTSKHQTCSLDDLVASFSAVRISATVLHPAPGPQNLNFGCQEHPQTPSFEVPSSLTQLLHVTSVGKHHLLCFFCTETIHHTQNHSVKAHPLPRQCHFSMNFSFQSVQSAWTAAHSRVCSSSHPSQEKLHTLKTPSRARLRSLNLLHMEPPPSCVATPLVKRNLEQFMVAECP